MAQDIFLKLSGINGEAQDSSHKDEIEVLRWDWEVSQKSSTHSGSGGGSGKATVCDLNLDHYVDRSSPNLMKFCLTGKHIANATLTVRKAGGSPLEFMKIVMDDVIVTSVGPGATDSMDRVREQISLSFAKVKLEYVVQNERGGSAGTVAAGFDIRANKEA